MEPMDRNSELDVANYGLHVRKGYADITELVAVSILYESIGVHFSLPRCTDMTSSSILDSGRVESFGNAYDWIDLASVL